MTYQEQQLHPRQMCLPAISIHHNQAESNMPDKDLASPDFERKIRRFKYM